MSTMLMLAGIMGTIVGFEFTSGTRTQAPDTEDLGRIHDGI